MTDRVAYTLDEWEVKHLYPDLMLNNGSLLRKDAGIGTGTTGAYNAVFGAKAYITANVESKAFGAMPKGTYEQAGFRFAYTLSDTSGGGLAEAPSGTIPATTAPTPEEITVGLREMSIAYEMSERMKVVQGKDDVLSMQALVEIQDKTFSKLLSVALLLDVDNDPTAVDEIESIDRLISNTAADVTGCGVTAADEDPYSYDRSANAGHFDGYVAHNGSAGTETDRSFTTSLVDSLDQNCARYDANAGGDDVFYLTGYDTYFRWKQQAENSRAYVSDARATLSVNGVKTMAGGEAGFPISTWNGNPIIVDSGVGTDTISRVYRINQAAAWIHIAKPVTVHVSPSPFSVNKFTDERAVHTIMNLKCVVPQACGKLRGLK